MESLAYQYVLCQTSGFKRNPQSIHKKKQLAWSFGGIPKNKTFLVAGFYGENFPPLDFCSSNDSDETCEIPGVFVPFQKVGGAYKTEKKNGGADLSKKNLQWRFGMISRSFCSPCFFFPFCRFAGGSRQRGAIVLLYTPSRSRLCLRCWQDSILEFWAEESFEELHRPRLKHAHLS